MQIEGASRQTLKQVWFLGSHGDVANGDERGSIGDIVLAWCVANLETHAGIAFDEVKLSVRFPRMGADLPMSNGLVWVHDDIRDPVKGLWRLMGRSIRVPNKQVLLMVSAQMKVFMKQHAFAVTVVAVVGQWCQGIASNRSGTLLCGRETDRSLRTVALILQFCGKLL